MGGTAAPLLRSYAAFQSRVTWTQGKNRTRTSVPITNMRGSPQPQPSAADATADTIRAQPPTTPQNRHSSSPVESRTTRAQPPQPSRNQRSRPRCRPHDCPSGRTDSAPFNAHPERQNQDNHPPNKSTLFAYLI